ncbi:BTAD domain-containing putative transcriptional regulator [Nocardia stercoris]|uniref:AfsR/SARP family transcriptional regulator n=1 Tax=Nocardia stercoris TaxID=2483361 RepID=A0A3M2LAF3_9NOCA|nr:BTAD domain-containing putative transcriptional regulator [Nocardia stercoris]RMI33680.1 AfsR/SARP family transcriptional regulator [Nocardia stercoris]
MRIGMLGALEVRAADGELLEVPGSRLRALVIALALEPGRVVPKTTLVDWIWGERTPADAGNALQALVSRLRRVLPDGSLEGQAGGYRLAVQPPDVDAVRFERLLDQARGGDDSSRAGLLREAVGLWRGAALQDVDLPESAAADAVVARFDGLRLAALEDLYDTEIRLGLGAGLVAELTDLVARNPLRERLVAALMRALTAAGRGGEALTVYQSAREALADELGVDPGPELSALHVALLRGEVGGPAPDRTTNLRAELTGYVGKDADIAAVRELVAAHRLTTITGLGGSGKTRLAVETGRTLLDDLPDGPWLVELAAAGPGSDLAGSALAALGLRDSLLAAPNADPIDRLVAAIRDRETLLILDNCEHVIEAAAAFAHRLLGECRRLRILATSREPLGITGEALWQVAPLSLPAPDATPAAVAASPAVALLRERATAVRPDFASGPQAAATMARVCRALDGIPLAIELAAARLRTMTLDQLADRLDDRFRLLTGGSRTALPHHRTLRAVVDWSWELLTEPERTVLRRIAVFAGGISLEAAEQVCTASTFDSATTVEQWEVLELLTALTEKSLLLAVPDSGATGPRYRMLMTIEQYARDRLTDAGEAEQARRAHLAYFTDFAATAEPRLRRADQLDWLAKLEAEHDNLAAAMRGALTDGAAEAMRLAVAAGWYWWLSGHKAEGLELLTAAAGAPGEVDDATRATVYGLVVHFATSGRSDEFQVEKWIREANRYGRGQRAGHPVLAFVPALERMLGGPDEVLPAFEAVLADEDPWVRALARLQLGKMRSMLGRDLDAVDHCLEQALTEFRVVGERWGISFALTELADRIAMRGEFDRACDYLDQAVAVVTEIGATEDIVRMRSRQAQLYRLAGDRAASEAAIAEAQRWADRTAWPSALAELALSRAYLARWNEDPAESFRQIDIAVTLLDGHSDQPYLEAVIHDLRGYLADDVAEARAHRIRSLHAATATGNPPAIAQMLVGLADQALRENDDEQAARLLAAATAVRGLSDRSHPDVDRVEQTARRRLGEQRFTEATGEGLRANWSELAESMVRQAE